MLQFFFYDLRRYSLRYIVKFPHKYVYSILENNLDCMFRKIGIFGRNWVGSDLARKYKPAGLCQIFRFYTGRANIVFIRVGPVPGLEILAHADRPWQLGATIDDYLPIPLTCFFLNNNFKYVLKKHIYDRHIYCN